MGFRTILIIEDDEATSKLVGTLLALGRFRTLEAPDAEGGLELARLHRPHCILMDIRLPGMDGLAATRLLKSDPQLRHIPVVAMTGFVGAEEEQEALAAGCEGFLTKPFDTRGFLENIERFLRNAHKEAVGAEPASRRARILIADDEPRVVEVFERQLTRAGYDCLPATGGRAALQLAQSEGPDLILLDVDDFKACNDTLGHLAGDIILREIGQIARQSIREIDLAARYGGEEFAVILPYTDRPGAVVVAERLHARIGSHPFLQGTSAGTARAIGSGVVHAVVRRSAH